MATQGKKPGGGMTVAEAGRMGGKLVSEKYGAGHFERIGRRGGQKVASLVERAKSLEGPERPEEPDEGERPAPEVRPEQSIGA